MLPQGIITDVRELKRFVNYTLTQDAFAFDVESAYENRGVPHLSTVTWISLATHGSAIVVPINHDKGEITGTTTIPAQYGGDGPRAGQWYNKTIEIFSEPPEQIGYEAFEILKPLFASTTILKIGHDIIFDLISIAKYIGFVPSPPYHCTLTAEWMLNENAFTHGLKETIERLFNFTYDKEGIGACVEKHPYSRVAYYSFCDSKMDFLLYLNQLPRLDKENLIKPFKFEMEVLNVLIGMRMTGIQVDVDKLKELQKDLTAKLIVAETEVYRVAGRKFNVNSTQQKQDILYLPKSQGGQELRPWKLTKGGKEAKKKGIPITHRHYSTDDEVLASYNNPLCEALRDYGDISKILSTYVNGWLGTENKDTCIFNDRLYASLRQYGTVTGRLSSRAPNLQNIPRSHSELGMLIRSVFTAEPNHVLVCADFSQIELVVLAHYIGYGALYEGFLNNIDPHTMTAALIYGLHPEDIVKDSPQRQVGKTINFAVVYGAGLNKVAATAKISTQEAKRILQVHEDQFPEIYDFKESVIQGARSRRPEPYITTLFGRKRRIHDLLSDIPGIRMHAERQIFNSVIQGGAADICLAAMVRMDAMLPSETKMLLQVHDEILCSTPKELEQETIKIMTEAMTGPGIQRLLKVPLKIDIHAGNSWAAIK